MLCSCIHGVFVKQDLPMGGENSVMWMSFASLYVLYVCYSSMDFFLEEEGVGRGLGPSKGRHGLGLWACPRGHLGEWCARVHACVHGVVHRTKRSGRVHKEKCGATASVVHSGVCWSVPQGRCIGKMHGEVGTRMVMETWGR